MLKCNFNLTKQYLCDIIRYWKGCLTVKMKCDCRLTGGRQEFLVSFHSSTALYGSLSLERYSTRSFWLGYSYSLGFSILSILVDLAYYHFHKKIDYHSSYLNHYAIVVQELCNVAIWVSKPLRFPAWQTPMVLRLYSLAGRFKSLLSVTWRH